MKKRLSIIIPIITVLVIALAIILIRPSSKEKEIELVKDAVEAQYKIETGKITLEEFCETYVTQPYMCSDERVTDWNPNINPNYTYKIKFLDVKKLDNSSNDITYYKVSYELTMNDEDGNIVHDPIFDRDYDQIKLTFSVGVTKVYGKYKIIKYGNYLNYQNV